MKKISCIIIAVLATTVAFANTTPINLLTYTNINNEIVITGFATGVSLTELNIPAQINGLPVTTIGEKAFQYTSITNTILPASVTKIESFAFNRSSSLESVTMPGIENIGAAAFAYCFSIESITLPDSLQAIGNNAFIYCNSLISLSIPDSVQSIGTQALFGCSALTSITVDANNSHYKSINNVLFNKSGTELIQYAPSLTASSYTAPNNVETISEGAFFNCSLESVTLPDSLHIIEGNAFNFCSSLTSINLPINLQSIGFFAFSSCSSLTSLTLPASVTSIGNEAFTFCRKLESITFLSTTPPTVGSNIFGNVAPSAIVYVHPSASAFGANFEGLPVEYFETDDPPTIQAIAYQNGNLIITLNEGTSGITVEETADITADNWTPISPTIDNGAFQLPTTHTHRYYRFTN